MNYKKYYSTKLKRDYITFLAFFLFGLLILFQIFVTVIAPTYIRRHNALNLAKEREEMFRDIDSLRAEANRVSVKRDSAESIEKELLIANLNDMALYIRNNHIEMNADQIGDMNARIRKNRMIVERWKGNKTAPFHLKREGIDITPYMKKLEASVQVQMKESSGKK